ncbi:Dihydrolipoyl dehydrogenase [Sulfobacillus acidophilus DSM 10332]|uniref:Dihydrolipoyl dehydrogenase n=1 Tax=Sulfobacillus acidophilus (strain ATCC 700253 / DSM 10332 / NAL) TaxID=679936 RepID=G8TSR7_SULAD|nr:Dihydrolipoyl dehydrogenase [Sulfobacillus acidophilus DSM 10332]
MGKMSRNGVSIGPGKMLRLAREGGPGSPDSAYGLGVSSCCEVIKMDNAFDLIVIGGGGGGYPAAFRLARAGRSVLLVDDKGNLGGNCLYEGCVPSKAVRESIALFQHIQEADRFGLQVAGAHADWRAIRAYKDGIQTRRYRQHTEEIEATPRLTFIRGRARFLDSRRVEVTDHDRGTQTVVTGTDILIAAGSEASALTVPGFELTWNHHQLFAWQDTVESLPDSVIIVGAGYIGLEVASMLADLGVKTTVLEKADTVLPGMDRQLASVLADILHDRITIITGVTVNAIVKLPGGGYQVEGLAQGASEPRRWQAGQVISAVGRRPYLTPELGLDQAGVHYSPKGIVVDAMMRTNVPHIWAAGDVTGQSMLFHAAVRMSEVAAHAILDPDGTADRFRAEEMPATVFTRPEAMSVGWTREMAERFGEPVFEVERSMGVEARAQIALSTPGFLKMVISRQTGQIRGIHAVGVDAADLSAVAHLIVRLGLTPRQLGQMTFPHPTQFEIFDRLARNV